MPIARPFYLRVLISPSLPRLQEVSATRELAFSFALTSPFLGTLQFVGAPSFIFFRSTNVFLSVLAEGDFIFVFFFDLLILFLETSVYMRQIDIVLLQCAVIIFLFCLDFTDPHSALSLHIYQESLDDWCISTVCLCTF